MPKNLQRQLFPNPKDADPPNNECTLYLIKLKKVIKKQKFTKNIHVEGKHLFELWIWLML
jgi:hypothetical protein